MQYDFFLTKPCKIIPFSKSHNPTRQALGICSISAHNISARGSVCHINNYLTWLSKILRFVSDEPKARHLQDTYKSRYFSISEFNNCFIIRSPILFFIFKSLSNSSGKRSAIFHTSAVTEYYMHL